MTFKELQRIMRDVDAISVARMWTLFQRVRDLDGARDDVLTLARRWQEQVLVERYRATHRAAVAVPVAELHPVP
jgi:hypothetical protein